MEVFVLKQPADISFTGNPMPYTLSLTPYGTLQQGQDLRISISIQVEVFPYSGSYNEVKTQMFYPDNAGLINFDVKSIIDAYLDFYTPDPKLDKPVEALNQGKRYRISYHVQLNGQPVTAIAHSAPLMAIKGGMSFETWHPVNFFYQTVLNNHKPLNFFNPKYKVHPDEIRFLFWLYPYDDQQEQHLFITIQTDDGNDIFHQFPTPLIANQWGICCAPAGFNMLNLKSLLPPDSYAVSFTLSVATDEKTIVAGIKSEIDHRNFYEPHQILYRNSMGAIDSIFIKGGIDISADYVRETADRVLPPSYYESGNILFEKTVTPFSQEAVKMVAETGFIHKQTADRLRDLFLSKQVYEYVNKKLLPITINNKSAKPYSNQGNASLRSQEIEWLRPSNSFYTPDDFAGEFIAGTECPMVEDFRVMVVGDLTLQVWWGLKTPYVNIEIEIVIGSRTFNYQFAGNTGTKVLYYNVIILGLMNRQPFRDGQIFPKARTICDLNTTPATVGPWKSVALSGSTDGLPVAGDDVFNINGGFNTPQQLAPSVLANDYDPNGDPIEVIPQSGPTSAGGYYEITDAGIVTYTPPSSAYSGADSFTYLMRKVDSPTNVTGNVTINVAVAPNANFFYIKQVFKNVTTYQQGRTSFTEGEIWIEFYKNSAGTIPLNITGLGVTIPYSITTKEKNPPNPATENQQLYNPPGTGVAMKLFQGLYKKYSSATPYLPVASLDVTIAITPTNYYATI